MNAPAELPEADVIIDEAPAPVPPSLFTLGHVGAAVVLSVVVAGCAVYANLSFAVVDSSHYQYFPPFRRYIDANNNRHLGAEYYNIARALAVGEGFASPFGSNTGPTAWMPPVLPAYLAALLWLCDGNENAVMTVFIVSQTATLIVTGWLVIALAWQTAPRVGVAAATVLFLVGVVSDFHLWFQQTHDCWIVLLSLDAVVAGYCWATPLSTKRRAAGWGLCGGIIALISPIAAFAWGILCLTLMARRRAWRRGSIAMLVALLTVTPWTVRNYLVFGRLIPVKSNAAYELWQSQCATPDGLLQLRVFGRHPFVSAGRERQQYQALGEMAYLDSKQELFHAAVEADPLDFIDRAAFRALGATLWYVPSDRTEAARRPWLLWTSRVLHPLPFLAVLFLVATALALPLRPAVWVGLGVYAFYLLPYIGVSYYERYAVPLLAVKVLLVVWAMDRVVSLCRPAAGVE